MEYEEEQTVKAVSFINIIFGSGLILVQPNPAIVENQKALVFKLLDLDAGPGAGPGKSVEIKSQSAQWLNGPATQTFTPNGTQGNVYKYTVDIPGLGSLDPEVIFWW